MLGWRARSHQHEKERQIENEKSIGERNEFSPRHPSDNGSEERIGDQHGHQCGGKHPRQRLQSIARGDAVADRAHDVVTGEDQEMKKKAKKQCAELVRLNVNDFGKELFQYEIVGRLCETAILLSGV